MLVELIYKKYNFLLNKKVFLIMVGVYGVLKNVKELCENFVKDDYV